MTVASLDDGAVGAKKNLVSAGAGLERHVAGGAVAMVVVGFDLECLGARAGVDADHRDAGAIGRDLLFTGTWKVNGEFCAGRSSVGVGGKDKDLVLKMGDQAPTFGNCSDEERGLADRDGFAASFGVIGGVLDGGFDEGARGAVAEWAPCKVAGEFEIKVIDAVVIGLSCSGRRFEDGNIHA